MNSKEAACATLMAVSTGALVFAALSSGASATQLVVSAPTMVRPVVATAATPFSSRTGAVSQSAATVENSGTYVEERVSNVAPVGLSAPQGSWTLGVLCVAGMIPAAVFYVISLLRRSSSSVMDPVADLGSVPVRPMEYNTAGPFGTTAGRASLALGARKGIHPELHEAKVYCAGEHVMTTLGTKKEYVVDIWSGNHPFYTKEGVLLADAGRIDKFKQKYGDMGSLMEIPAGAEIAAPEAKDTKKKKGPKKGKR